MLVKGALSNLIGGISQQASALRLANQSQDELNTYPVIVDGNKKRPMTEHIAVLPTTVAPTAYTHFILRDAAERYAVAVTSAGITVTDLAGNIKTVTAPHGYGYLAHPDGLDSDSFAALTIADYTFIVNKTVATGLTTATSPTRLPEALLNIAAGNYGKTYSVTVNGSVVASFTTPAGTSASVSPGIDTTYIAASLVYLMTGNHTAGVKDYGSVPYGDSSTGTGVYSTAPMTAANGWNVQAIGNAVWIQSLTGVDFSVSVVDGYNGNAMKLVKKQAQRFTDLPAFGPAGFVAQIVGDDSNVFSSYYVQFSITNTGNSQGVWKECPAPGLKIALDTTTMPHTLVRNADGTFTFDQAVWAQQLCGDDDTAPKPSFVGKTISDMSFHQNRLMIFADDNVVMTRAGDFFNWFRTTVVSLLDDDPIDVNAAASQVSFMRAATPYQESLLLWSDLNQFSLSGNALLTPKTVNMNLTTSYENLSASIKPVTIPRRIFFCIDRNQWVGLKEWYYDVFYHIGQADESSAHVPTLIPSGAFKMANSTIEDCLVLGTTGDPSSLYVYKYYWSQQDKLQSAWVKWTFPGATILNFEFVNSTLYLFLNRNGQTVLESMRLNPMLLDQSAPPIYLDRRVASEACPSTGYSTASDTTRYTLPYAPDPASFHAVTRTSAGSAQFVDVPVASISGNVVTLQGNTSAYLMYFGQTYTTYYVFSPIYVRQPDGSGQSAAEQEGRLQLLKLDVTYAQAGYFRVEVTPPGRDTQSYEFDGWRIGDTLADVDSLGLRDGVLTVPVLARSDDVDIRIVNDSFLPARFIRAEWKGNFVPKSRK